MKSSAKGITVYSRLHEDIVNRLDNLREKVSQIPEWAPTGNAKRSDVIRLALEYGIAQLEKELRKKSD